MSIAYESIQDRRATRIVPCGPGGVLHDYVPFYFGARSPMLYANYKGQVITNSHGQQPLVYLVSSVEAVHAQGLRWVFTDGHAVIQFTRFFDDLTGLACLDWDAVHALWWMDTAEDPDRKRRKQAEFLVHAFVPFHLIHEVVVLDPYIRSIVIQVLAAAAPACPVTINPAWYY